LNGIRTTGSFANTAGKTILKAENLTKRYGSLTAVDSLSLEIQEGEIFGFLGPNGAGKTTTINMVCGLLKPDNGNVFIDGKNIKDDYKIKSHVGVCPQNLLIWEKLTCLEQLEFTGSMYNIPAGLARKRGMELLEIMGLKDKAHKTGKSLSGGMQRRLNLILALVHDPRVIVLDEPEAGLDPQSRVLVREYIRTLSGKKTIIITTHNMDEADRMADRIAIIDHGKLLKLDTPKELKRNIGEGDILEIEIDISSFNDSLERNLKQIVSKISLTDHTILIRERGILEKIPAILELLKSNNINLKNLRLRENSLEDVFITLTGRRLRE
jgi:ABC-2 type transport system ATP-binding protein